MSHVRHGQYWVEINYGCLGTLSRLSLAIRQLHDDLLRGCAGKIHPQNNPSVHFHTTSYQPRAQISSKSRTTLPVFASLSLMLPLRSLCPKRRITWSTLSLTGTDPEQQIPSLGLLCAPSSHMWWKQQSLLLPGRKYRMHHWWPGKMRTTLSDWSPVWKGNHTTVKSCLYF